MSFRRRPRRFKPTGVYLLPNLLTTLSLFAGFYSIISSFDGQLERAAWFVLVAALFDRLDGMVARISKSSSRFGLEYDSLSDLVGFGVAPAVLLYVWALEPFGRLGWLAGFLYLASTALRLARFNVQVEAVEPKRFVGLPSPGAAGVVATTVLFYSRFINVGIERSLPVLIITFLLGFLMVSNVKYRSFKELDMVRSWPIRPLFIAALLIILVAAEPVIMLFSLFYVYMVVGMVEGCIALYHRFKVKRPAPERAEGP